MEIDKPNPESTAGKRSKENFTAERIAGYKCGTGKRQTLYWDAKTPGLGLRVTSAGAKSYIFETSLHGKTLRLTIGDPRTWSIKDAQSEATRLKTQTDQGIDPRQLKIEQRIALEAKAATQLVMMSRESVTVLDAWTAYMADRKPHWGERHYNDHLEVIHAGGAVRKRSKKMTEPAVLASLAGLRLFELTPDIVTNWAKAEGEKRAGRARLAVRLLKAFLSWCNEHPTYSAIVTGNAAKNKKAREQLGKPGTLDIVLQKEQLKAWFEAVKNIPNQVQSAYFQTLLLTGARPNEFSALKWEDVNFQWEQLTIRDKVEGVRVIPLTPYIASLLSSLPKRVLRPNQLKSNPDCVGQNPYIFSSPTSASGHIEDPHDSFYKVCATSNIDMTIYGLRGSFATLSEWIETPAGIAAQIQGHKPSGVREKHYIRRPLDILRMWHIKIEKWILSEAGIHFEPEKQYSSAVK